MKNGNRSSTVLFAVCSVLWVGAAGAQSTAREVYSGVDLTIREEMVAMPAGVKLYTLILTPKISGGKLPILLERNCHTRRRGGCGNRRPGWH